MTILYIEDDQEDQEIFREIVKGVKPQAAIFIANDGMEAISLLNDIIILPDLIFLDLNMPMISGKDFLSMVKKDERLKSIPVVVYTTSTSNRDVTDSIHLGAHKFINKGSTLKEASERLADFFGNA